MTTISCKNCGTLIPYTGTSRRYCDPTCRDTHRTNPTHTPTPTGQTAAQQLHAHTAPRPAADGCWPWLGPTRNGYGVLGGDYGRRWAHYAAYELHTGPVPDNQTVQQTCHNRRCVNPQHLQAAPRPATTEQKQADALNRVKTTLAKKGKAA